MKLIIEEFDNYLAKDSYILSFESFIYNGKELLINDKFSLLNSLIYMTKDWKEEKDRVIESGFKIVLEIDNNLKNYIYEELFPDNFSSFIYRVGKLKEDNDEKFI